MMFSGAYDDCILNYDFPPRNRTSTKHGKTSRKEKGIAKVKKSRIRAKFTKASRKKNR